MALPKISQPLFQITIPSTGKKTTFRQYTVKEEKILLIAQESKDFEQIALAIKQIITNCVTDVNVDNMPMFDIEYLLLNIRSKSVGDKIDFEVTDPDTEEKVKLVFDINNVEVVKKNKVGNKIKLDDRFTITMKYPSINQVSRLGNDDSTSQTLKLFNLMLSCMESLFDAETEELFMFADFTQEEVDEFVENNLPSSAIAKIKEFFENIPVVRFSTEYVNSKGDKKTFVIEGLNSFFI